MSDKDWEVREMKGSLNRNRKRPDKKDPDFRGQCRINGQLYSISMWEHESSKGNQWFSLSFTEGDTRKAVAKPETQPQQAPADDDDVPF